MPHYIGFDLSYKHVSSEKYKNEVLSTNTYKSSRHRTIRDFGLFYYPNFTRLAIAPFGYSDNSDDNSYSADIYKLCDYSFKAMLLDLLDAVINQLLPTAIWNMICDDICDYQNDHNSQFDVSFYRNCVKAVLFDYPLSVIVFALRVVATILFLPHMVYAHHQSVQYYEQKWHTSSNLP